MPHLPVVLPCLLTLSLSACLSFAPSDPDEQSKSIPSLKLVHFSFLPIGNDFFAFSEDGTTFVLGGGYDGVALYRANDYSLLERYYERDRTHPEYEGDTGKYTGHIIASGYADENTWYFAADIDNPDKPSDNIAYITNIHFRSIHPSREIAKYSVKKMTNNSDVTVNKDYFAYSGFVYDSENQAINSPPPSYYYQPLINWRTGKQYRVKTTFMYIGFDRYELTRSNRLLTHAINGDKTWYPGALLDDPINKTTEKFDRNIILTPDEHYLIDLSSGYCELKKTSGKEVGNIKEKTAIGRCSDRFQKKETDSVKIAFAPDGQLFAVATDRSVRVYRIEPFQLELEAKTQTFAVNMAISDNGWLALVDLHGDLRVWDIESERLVGRHISSDYDGKHNRGLFSKLAFQPGSNKLFLILENFSVFELPERPAPQKSQ